MRSVYLLCFGLLALFVANAYALDRPYKEGEVLVKYKSRATAESKASLAGRYSERILREFTHLNVHHLKLPEGTDVMAAIESLKKEGDVEYAEPNYTRKPLSVTPNDQAWLGQWGMVKIGMADAWTMGQGSSTVIIAVLDTGVDYNHPDLKANMWTNPGEIPGNGIDDDGNGYVDDVRGWNFVDNNNIPMDADGHGTHVAGIIGAVGNNSIGVAGVNWSIRIMPVKFMSSTSGAVSDEVSGIQYAVQMGAKVINASYGDISFSQTEQDAIQSAGTSGVLFVAAAGNDGTDNDRSTKNYPSSYALPNIIAVAATDSSDNLASFSNYGAMSVHLAAPGDTIESTVAEGLTDQTGPLIIPPSNSTHLRAKTMDYGGQIPAQGITRTMYSCGLGLNPQDFPAAVSGNIALIERGTNYFSEKATNAMSAGAIAAIIYDNQVQTTAFSGTLGSTGNWIPVISITNSDGLSLASQTGSLVSLISPYDIYSGTSMATPFVSGTAGLLLAAKPDLSMAQIKDAILQSVDAVPSLNGKVSSGGRLNAYHALQTIQRLLSQLTLQAGWNLISLPKQPADMTTETVLASIDGKWSIVWGEFNPVTYTWKYRTDQGGGSLTTMGPGKGYWIYVTSGSGTTLPVTGTVLSPGIPLKPGWNFVGYLADAESTSDALASIARKYSIVWGDFNPVTSSWKYRTSQGAGTLNTMGPGKGYWIYNNTTSDVVWTIP